MVKVVNVPVKVLLGYHNQWKNYLGWRIPDRDIHRYLMLNGSRSTPELMEELRLDNGVLHNALNRLARHKLVRCSVETLRPCKVLRWEINDL